MTEHFDPAPDSAAIASATDRLLHTVRGFTDSDVHAASILPGWTRGHVLTHVARNADGAVNVLSGAATGVIKPAYPSREARDADIDAGAGRPVAEILDDLESSNRRFSEAVAALPPEQWTFQARWGTAGQTRPVHAVLGARLREVAIHHLDLGADYDASMWPPEFALRLLRSVAPVFGERGMDPVVLVPSDVDGRVTVGTPGAGAPDIAGPAHALLTWLIGRDSGSALTSSGDLPKPPAW